MSAVNPMTGQIGNSADFCQVFSLEIDSLYTLALLLIGNHEAAENCLLVGLESCLSGRPVPESSARSWSRWSVIRQAATVTLSRRDLATVQPSHPLDTTDTPMMLAIAGLPSFERFAFVVTVLERYSVRECATLLHCKTRDVIQARVRAMQGISANLQAFPTTAEAPKVVVQSSVMVAA